MDRASRILSEVDIDSLCGLEIGPLDKALVARKPGRKIYYADYATRETLRTKSLGDPHVNIDMIPEIDFIVSPLPSNLGMTFDYIVASHVIEHTPDLIGWVKTLLNWLNPEGKLILAIPDKRYTFDRLRELSTTGQLIDAHLTRRSIPSPTAIYDGFSRAVNTDLIAVWEKNHDTSTSDQFMFSKEASLQLVKKSLEKKEYVDCHCWVFTSKSFIAAIEELIQLDLLATDITNFFEPIKYMNEFYVTLSPSQSINSIKKKYEGKIIAQRADGRGRDDGWFLIKNGMRKWILNAGWLDENGYSANEIMQVDSSVLYKFPEDPIPLS